MSFDATSRAAPEVSVFICVHLRFQFLQYTRAFGGNDDTSLVSVCSFTGR
jgi:hypothetical protein